MSGNIGTSPNDNHIGGFSNPGVTLRVTTNRATARKEEAMNTLYAGIDLHSNNSVLVISNEKDEVLYDKRLKNDISDCL